MRSRTSAATTEEPPASPSSADTRAAAGITTARRAAARGSRDLELPAVGAAERALVEIEELSKVFTQRGHDVHALTEVSAAVWPGETLGLVGESGSGKTTLARTLLGSLQPARAT